LRELADTGLLERRVGHGTVGAFDAHSWQAGPTAGIASTEVPAEDSLTLGITARLIGRLSTARAADVDRESFG
jgi:hypothetical protein